MQQSEPSVIVVGAGWAGLAAAVELSRHNIPVTVLESAKQLGGRARRVPFNNTASHDHTSKDNFSDSAVSIDNGQHMLVGAYESTLTLLRTLDVKEEDVFKRQELSLTLLSNEWKTIRFKTPRIPAPLHLAWGLLTTSGLSIHERMRALQFSRELAKQDFTLANDETCLSLFSRYRQPHKVIKALWEPLCLGGLNTPINQASAEIFLRMLRETFAHTRNDSNLLLTKKDLSAIFPEPAMDYIERHGGSIRLGQRVKGITLKHDSISSVKLDDNQLKTQCLILATPFYLTAKFLDDHAPTKDLANSLSSFQANPICTVYLQYPKDTQSPQDVLGMVGTYSQWLFDRKIYNQPGLMAVVISGPGEHMDMTNDDLIGVVSNELARQFPHWPRPLESIVIREKRATFHCAVDINRKRPGNKTPIKGLWLAGDYTNTALPATLEGAVRSGVRAARRVIDSLQHDE